jgi:hypothetical protein
MFGRSSGHHLGVVVTVLPFLSLLVGGLCGVLMGRHGKDGGSEGTFVKRGDIVGGVVFSLMAVIAWVTTSGSALNSGLRFLPLAALVVGWALGLAMGIATRRTK